MPFADQTAARLYLRSYMRRRRAQTRADGEDDGAAKIYSDHVEMTALPDTGCDVSPSCFTCPLPQCKYDDPVAYQAYLQRQRDLKLVAMYEEGDPVHKVATRGGVSPRTVHRALERIRNAKEE